MTIIPRAAWGARAARHVDTVSPRSRTLFIVHYSAGRPSQSVRAIQDWCMDPEPKGRGFSDIDYNFVVRGTSGEIYEGRGWNAIGSHTKGHNTEGIGVCVMSDGPISNAAQASVRWLYAEAVRRAGHPLTVQGHRDLDQTVCPGDEIYRWVHGGGVTEPGQPIPRTLQLAKPLMKGADVVRVQALVGATRDGVYGPKTALAVQGWQKIHGLTIDGIVGPVTRKRMGL